MTRHYKLPLAAFALLLSAFANGQLSPNFQPAPAHKSVSQPAPKVVFVGDYVTAQWSSAFAANPNWINKGVDFQILGQDNGTADDVLAGFPANVVSLHPAAVHIMIGQADANSAQSDSYLTIVPTFMHGLNEIVLQAKAANIKVILGIEPYLSDYGYLTQINSGIAAYGAANNITVINYGDALCGCVNSTRALGYGYISVNSAATAANVIPGDVFNLYGGGPFFGPPPPGIFPDSGPGSTEYVVTPTGYNLMTNLAESVINTMNSKLVAGWLSNVEQANFNTDAERSSLINVNTVQPEALLKFIPIGYYSDGSRHAVINSTFQGASGTWTSSNPTAIYVNQSGLAWALSPGRTTIKYTPPNGVAFTPWVMNVTE